MKIRIRISFAVLLIGIFIACSSEQIKKVGDLLPEVLANVTQAYGNPYGALIGGFFNLITGSDYKHEAAEVLKEEGSSDQTEGTYYSGEESGNYSQDQEYYGEQSQSQTGESGQGDYQSGSQPTQSPPSGSGQGYYQAGSQQPQSSTSGSGQGYYQGGSQQPQSPPSGSGQGYYQAQPQSGQTADPYQPASRTDFQPLEVSIDVVKEQYINGRYQAVPVANGDTLTQRDNYKILFQSNSACYMYIAQLDATGKMDPILPSRFTSYRNPIRPGMLHDIPSGTNWFYLDANFGVETIYFIASLTPRPDIEQLFMQLEATNRTLIQQKQVSMDSAYVVTRGIGGMRPGGSQPVSFQNGSQGQFTSTLIQSIQADFVMTRWFHHR